MDNFEALGMVPMEDELSMLAGLRAKLGRLKEANRVRDDDNQKVLSVREGRMRDVFPALFPEVGPLQDKSIVANMVDVAAHDLAESQAPLPAFNCHSSKSSSDAAQKFTEKRTKIALNYIEFSDLQAQMYWATDQYYTYGFVPAMVEIDTDNQMPRIMVMDSIGAYPVFNRWRECEAVFFVFTRTHDELVAEYPHCRTYLPQTAGHSAIEVVRYHDKDVDLLFLSGEGSTGRILQRAKNPAGECLVEWIQKPSLTRKPRGQFDDVLAVQVAKARFAMLGMEAATQAVQAPIVVPDDVTDLAFGPNATIRTRTPAGVARLRLDVPPDAFRQQGVLDEELRQGSRHPQVRNGEVDGSIVTGKGIQELQGGFNSQIRTGQSMFQRALMRLVGKCFLVDDKVFGGVERTITGNVQGTPYEITYRPNRDIKGDYTIDVQYGLMAGLDANRALVFGLQLRGDKAISREFMQGNLPFPVDTIEMNQQIDIEDLRDGAKQAYLGFIQALPALMQAGQDPAALMKQASEVVKYRMEGKPIEDALALAFTPPELPGVDDAGAGGSPPGQSPPGTIPGLNDATGQLRGTAQGQAGLPLGGVGDVQQLLAGLTGQGNPNLAASVSRRLPT